MANKSVAIASSFAGEPFESIHVEFSDSDSDSWQFIDPSDSDDQNFSCDDVTTTDDDDEENEEFVLDVDDLLQLPYGSPSSDTSMQSLVDEMTNRREVIDDGVAVGGLIDREDDPYEEDEDEIEEEDDDDLDLDDELVPKWLNNKFGRQRMRKLGKRAYPKMKKSKRVAYMYNKPGCVHGKHGLGTKHNFVW